MSQDVTNAGSGDSRWEAVIGLEVHAQLNTRTKIFSPAPVAFGSSPNSHVNEICSGMPGALPVLNEEAVNLAVLAGVALDCRIHEVSIFDRKNYFYPDLPKGYQITQFSHPICTEGHVDIEVDGVGKRVNLTQIHMEEDAGKSSHEGNDPFSRIDLNRAGTPLIEIVSEPEIRSADEAAAYFRELRDILVTVGVNDGNMSEGSLRCDANVSIRPRGQSEFGTRVEIKNLNSFKYLRDAVRFEIKRQIREVEAGNTIVQETRLWNESQKRTWSMRRKEGSADYRYMPEPDLPVLRVSAQQIAAARASLPELPAQARRRLSETLGLTADDARTLVSNHALLYTFDDAVQAGMTPQLATNWLLGQASAAMNEERLRVAPGGRGLSSTTTEFMLTGAVLLELQQLVDEGTINLGTARQLFDDLVREGGTPASLVAEKGLQQVSDTDVIDGLINEVLAERSDEVAAYRAGKKKVVGFLMGQVMRRTAGKGNPKLVKERLFALLDDA